MARKGLSQINMKFVTILSVVLVCLSNLACGQQVTWLFVPKSHQDQRQTFRNGDFYRDKFGGNEVFSVSSSSDEFGNNPFELPPFRVRPPYQRSISTSSVPTITPVFITEYANGYWQNVRRNKERDSASHAHGHGSDNKVLVMMGKEKEDEEDSSGSASTELEMDKFSFVNNPTELSVIRQEVEPAEAAMISSANRCVLEGHQARFDPVTGGCFTLGTRGPCGNLMIFTAMPSDNLNGMCDCDYDSFDRPMAYIRGQCHFLFTQALCYPGYWLTSSSPNSEPVCQLNPCHDFAKGRTASPSSTKNPFVIFKGECVRLHSTSRHCRREGEVVLFPKGSIKPACGFPKSTKRIYRRQISSINRFACGSGMRRHRITKKCMRIRTRAVVFA